jgi:hypothetical protein
MKLTTPIPIRMIRLWPSRLVDVRRTAQLPSIRSSVFQSEKSFIIAVERRRWHSYQVDHGDKATTECVECSQCTCFARSGLSNIIRIIFVCAGNQLVFLVHKNQLITIYCRSLVAINTKNNLHNLVTIFIKQSWRRKKSRNLFSWVQR